MTATAVIRARGALLSFAAAARLDTFCRSCGRALRFPNETHRAIFVLSVKLVPLAEKLNVSLMAAIKWSYIRLVPV